jgi:hypothetical protein
VLQTVWTSRPGGILQPRHAVRIPTRDGMVRIQIWTAGDGPPPLRTADEWESGRAMPQPRMPALRLGGGRPGQNPGVIEHTYAQAAESVHDSIVGAVGAGRALKGPRRS